MAEEQKRPAEPALPVGTHRVQDLAQLRALADPLRLRILGALGGVPRTTKQVAEMLGEKPTRLYHHVESLERVGLIRLTETRPNRGTLEKYYQAVAAQFEVSSSALSPETGEKVEPSAQEALLTSLLDTTRKELLANLRPGSSTPPSPEEAPLVARVTTRGSGQKIQVLRRQLLQWVEQIRAAEAAAECSSEEEGKGEASYTFTVVFCRTDSMNSAPSRSS
jgi:DNA-binding transcriptional ArsR family regulator